MMIYFILLTCTAFSPQRNQICYIPVRCWNIPGRSQSYGSTEKKSLHIPHHTTNKTIQTAKKNCISDTGNRTRALPALGSVLLDESGKS
jgi:hypothetical protein